MARPDRPQRGPSCTLHALGNATRNFSAKPATARATEVQQQPSAPPTSSVTGREVRVQLRMQQARNNVAEPCNTKPVATRAELHADAAKNPAILAENPAPAANDAQAHESTPDPEVERRCAKALALLADYPNWRRVVIVEAGAPTIIGIAIRGIGYGEFEIPVDRYDALALLELLDRYALETGATIH